MPLTLNPSQFYTLYSPSKCELRLYYSSRGVKSSPPSAFEEVLFQLGQRHEKNHLNTFPDYRDLTNAPFEKTLEAVKKGTPVLYQGKLQSHTALKGEPVQVTGIPDFIIREGDAYTIRDCKIAQYATEDRHPEITRQLQVYGWLYERATGQRPHRLEVLLGDGNIEHFDYEEDIVPSYLASLLDVISLPKEPYSPVGWSKCIGCGFRYLCWPRAEENNDVALVYGVDQNLVGSLRKKGVVAIQNLSEAFNEESLAKFRRPWGRRHQKVGKKAREILLQAESMLSNQEIVLKKPGLPVSPNYVMFDLEGLPPQLDEMDKIYLWGMQVFGEQQGSFQYALAETGPEGDERGWEAFLTRAKKIFVTYGDIPFVHWHSYEKIKIETYLERYGDREGIAERILSNLVDLLPITREAIVLPVPSYSLKVVEKQIGFQRSQSEYGGDWSIAKYIEAVETEDEEKRRALIEEILKYNEEDLQATWAVFTWLKSLG